MFDFLGVLVLAALAALFGWLATRAWRVRNAILKWVGVVLSGLFVLIFSLLLVLMLVGFYRLNQNYNASHPAPDIAVAMTAENIARGEKFANFCAGCHSPNQQLPLSGRNFLDPAEGGPPAGTLYAPNLTPAGEIAEWSDGEILRAIREGVHKSGRSLLIMPSEVFRNLSDADAQAVVAYLRSQPAAGERSPDTRFNAVGAVLVTTIFPAFTVQPHITQPIIAPLEGPTAEYGEYLISVLACRVCHGGNLAGGQGGAFGPPAGPNLTAIVPQWSEDEFVTFFRTGVDTTGRNIDPEVMPWKEFSDFATDDDLKALYAYLHGLAPIEAPAD